MNVHPQGIQLLPQAQRDGVGDIPALRKWLKQAERRGQHTDSPKDLLYSYNKNT